MLLSFKVDNFAVFKNTIDFSMKPGRVMSRFEDNVIDINSKMNVSKITVIAGENASGKTYFMKSLHFFKYLLESNKGGCSIKRLCHNFDQETPQKFEIVVLINNKIYTYEITIDKMSPIFEKLSVRGYTQDKLRDKQVFKCNRTSLEKLADKKYLTEINVETHDSFVPKEISKLLQDKSKNNSGLFINNLSALGIEIVRPFMEWIEQKLIIDIPSELSLNIYKKMKKDERDIEIIKKDDFLEIFTLVDSSIVRVEVDEEDPFRETEIIRKRRSDGAELSMPIKDDSSGVNEFFAWSIQIWKVIHENATLFADELDKVLNPILSSKVLSFIKGSEHNGQFIFSTHNILHINTIDFMKEQIYFVSKDAETLTSEMYSLADFKEYRYEKANVYELYLKGLLGGVPND